MSELRGLGAVHNAMKALGGRLVAISVDPPEKSREVIRRNALPFAILSDADATVIRNYGVVHTGGGERGEDIAIPALFLVDRDGRIVWRRVAVRIQDRPDPQEIIAVIRSNFAK